MAQLLDIKQLNKTYEKSNFSLDNISFSIDKNEVVGLIGQNGSGKTTLINTIVGNRSKDSGDISFFSKTITQDNYRYKEQIGVVFDDLRVPNKLTIKGINQVFNTIFETWNSERFLSLIEQFELPQTNMISTFSRGMRMKSALAIALAHDSKLLILDEATAGMDVSGREQVMEMLEDFINDGNSILISSHISEDIEQLATKLVFMKDGKVILEEEKDKLLTTYGIIKQPMESFNIPNELIVASRIRKQEHITLVNDYTAIAEAEQLQQIDEATKIIMRGET
ncbi:ABC transporter ATP-binding protein [Staphylococcus sp. 18_1_E_LY]|uniref:ABC transporter ATP-binding protein n=1 Tax=Staphylococcus lloydii TaxID=2781774 RepID=A0A7T1B082_9STAP|nr:ABC transporter ATP-binding protein [Staphylococcus lloydii]MBF7019991.1 ABC transporter ATP-binding protein [Staphylococcus lloydii]MBF7027674.1 ABC transporter ATP-binding protein [Staphylococcus lloydii]QPM75356.1 ABC transporter ATP-binding protein [Staphylococcus lloydii]